MEDFEYEEEEFEITVSYRTTVVAESYEDAVDWVRNYVLTDRHIEFDIE
jgi:hypothetical protein